MDEAVPGATKHRNRGYAWRSKDLNNAYALRPMAKVVSRLWGYRNEAVGAGGRLVRSSAQSRGSLQMLFMSL